MTLSEQGMFDSSATSSSGIILGELSLNGEIEEITVGWISSTTAPDLNLEDGFTGMESRGAIIDRGQFVESIKSEHRMIYQYFNATGGGETLHGIAAVWYCDILDKYYMFLIMQSEQDVLPKFQRYIDSFICH